MVVVLILNDPSLFKSWVAEKRWEKKKPLVSGVLFFLYAKLISFFQQILYTDAELNAPMSSNTKKNQCY